MPDWIVCPVCGRKFDASEYECLDNGNPACPDCVVKERRDEKESE